MLSAKHKYDVVVLGSGVIGLSCALELDSAGFKVAIIAKDLPEDTTSTGWASPWAGCIWHPLETDPSSRSLQWDMKTFHRLGKLAQDHPDLCERIPFVDVYQGPLGLENIPWHGITGDFREVIRSPTESLPGDYVHGHKYTSYVLNAPKYTAHLGSVARARGIPTIRYRVSSLDEAYNIPQIGPVDLVVNATGLGAQSLIGVEDHDVYPVRGQTVLVKAPKARTSIMRSNQFDQILAKTLADEGKAIAPTTSAYIIPRPGPEGHVILGGTYDRYNYSTLPDRKIAEKILQECYTLEPNLVNNGGKSWRDIEVVSINVGLRPSREGGARIELENRILPNAWNVGSVNQAKKGGDVVGVIHAYGFGGVGFISSLGAAEEVLDLARKYKTRSRAKSGEVLAKL